MGQRLLAEVLSRHASVIMVLHDMDMALTHFDRVIGLREGRKILDIEAKLLDVDTLETFYQDSSEADSAGGRNDGGKGVVEASGKAQIKSLQCLVKQRK